MSNGLASDNRRGAYRVQPESADELDLAILAQRHHLVRSEVTDVAVGGAQIRLDKASAPPLVSGERVTVAMTSARYNYTSEMPARIVWTSEDAAEQTVHLSFEGHHVQLKERGEDVFSIFNRRTMYRGVTPPATSDFHAMVSPNTVGDSALRSHAVAIRNISNVGVSLIISAATHRALHDQEDISLSLQLPDKTAASRIACHVRHRSPDGDSFIYGCEYDWSATTDPLAVVEDLVEYMLECIEPTPERRDP